MKILLTIALLLALAPVFGQSPGLPVVKDKIKDELTLSTAVTLTGMLNDRLTINLEKRLLAIDSATLLSGFEHRPGSQVWIGEHVGKFLYTAANTWRYTHDPRLKSLTDAIQKTYIQTQLADGYLGTYLPKDYWTEWDVWAHKYAIYGLLGYYSITGDKSSLRTAEKAADLICRTFGPAPGQRDINRSGWHAGLASGSILGPMIDLYRYTGKEDYLRFARYLLTAWEDSTGPKIISNLQRSGRVDKIGDAKAYEMLSCFVGILQYYRLTGETRYLQAMETAWRDIVANRLYVTGTSSSFEVFQGDHQLPGANKDDIGEGCVTVTWLQFNAQLLALTGKMAYAEEIERSIYNHLLAAEDPSTGCVSYYTPITGIKPYKCDQGFSCCLSSVPGGISLIPFLTYGRSTGQLWVLLYESGHVTDTLRTANGERLPIRLECQSNFPVDGKLVYTIRPSHEASFGINFRVPDWATGFTATVNGQTTYTPNGAVLTLQRNWKTGDNVTINLQMPLLKLTGAPSFPGQVAYKRGPQVLAEDSLLTEIIRSRAKHPEEQSQDTTVITDISTLLPKNWQGKQAYAIRPAHPDSATTIVLTPFADAGQLNGPVTIWLPGH